MALQHLKFTLLVMVGVYPLITILSYLIAPLTTDWEIWQRTALLSPLMVVAMIYGLIAAIQSYFAKSTSTQRDYSSKGLK